MTDFTWVKDAARRNAVLKDYLELRSLSNCGAFSTMKQLLTYFVVPEL